MVPLMPEDKMRLESLSRDLNTSISFLLKCSEMLPKVKTVQKRIDFTQGRRFMCLTIMLTNSV